MSRSIKPLQFHLPIFLARPSTTLSRLSTSLMPTLISTNHKPITIGMEDWREGQLPTLKRCIFIGETCRVARHGQALLLALMEWVERNCLWEFWPQPVLGAHNTTHRQAWSDNSRFGSSRKTILWKGSWCGIATGISSTGTSYQMLARKQDIEKSKR